MKRLTIALCAGLSAVLLSTSLAGCGGGDPEPKSTPSPSSTGNTQSGAGTTSTSSGGATTAPTTTPSSGGGGQSSGGTTASAGSSTGGASGGSGGGGGSAAPGTCVGKIENKTTACTAACFDYQCGVHRLGLKDCDCPAGVYECESCAYSGTEEIVQAPAEALAECADTDVNLEESQTPCTKGDRCYFYDTAGARDRLCACWDDGLGSTAWDCDTYPGDWPKPG